MLGKLSILVPVFHEAATVERLLRRVAEVSFPIEREIVAVDDGSSDGSREVLQRLGQEGLIRWVAHEVNRGKGAAVQTAVRHAQGDVLVVQDADLELDPGELPGLLAPILNGETSVCYGSRSLNGASAALRRRPAYWANRLLNALSNRLNGLRITDFNTCYKMMTAQVMHQLDLTQNGFALEPEITTKLARLGYTIVERPIRYQPRSVAAGKKIRAADFFKYVAVMVRCRLLWSPSQVPSIGTGMSPSPSLSVAEMPG